MSTPSHHGYFSMIRTSSERNISCAPSVFSRNALKMLFVPSLATVSSHLMCGHFLIYVRMVEPSAMETPLS